MSTPAKWTAGDYLGALKDGTPVFDRADSHLAGHPDVRPLLPEVLARIALCDFESDMLVRVLDMGRPVGMSHCVLVSAEETVLYAWRHGRHGCSRFVKDRSPQPCSSVKVVLWKDLAGVVLVTAFIGTDVAPEPWSSGAATESARAAAVEFWKRHALIWDPALVDESKGLREQAPDFWRQTPAPT